MPFAVTVIESERGWGQRVDDVLYFKEIDSADAFVKKFNSKNTALVAPDWYMQAEEPQFVREVPIGKILQD